MTETRVTAAVFGAAGFTGGEMCRLLLGHPGVDRIVPTSRGEEGFERLHPNLAGSGLEFEAPETLVAAAGELDVAFLCLPAGEAMDLAAALLDAGVAVVDLGPDFRFDDADAYARVYGRPHSSPELLAEAACGISELNRERIRSARLVANPGCYVIAATLALAPVLRTGVARAGEPIHIAAVNGTSGAGGSARREVMHAAAFGSMLPYSLEGHRHGPEMEDRFAEQAGGAVTVSLSTAHGDFARGIQLGATLSVDAGSTPSREELLDLYLDTFGAGHEGEYFVQVNDLARRGGPTDKDYSIYPSVREVLGSNFCHLGVDVDADRSLIKLVATIDNLVKGAAGSALQNMNLMLGFEEQAGLRHYGL
jgi:N-acetyl-gamma-glutamyl-phosphate reductase common form